MVRSSPLGFPVRESWLGTDALLEGKTMREMRMRHQGSNRPCQCVAALVLLMLSIARLPAATTLDRWDGWWPDAGIVGHALSPACAGIYHVPDPSFPGVGCKMASATNATLAGFLECPVFVRHRDWIQPQLRFDPRTSYVLGVIKIADLRTHPELTVADMRDSIEAWYGVRGGVAVPDAGVLSSDIAWLGSQPGTIIRLSLAHPAGLPPAQQAGAPDPWEADLEVEDAAYAAKVPRIAKALGLADAPSP